MVEMSVFFNTRKCTGRSRTETVEHPWAEKLLIKRNSNTMFRSSRFSAAV